MKSAEEDTETINNQQADTRKIGRIQKARGYTAEQETDKNTNNSKLGVYEVPGIGHGFFAIEAFSIKDRVIWVDHGKRISKKYAYAKTQLSHYIVEVTDHYKLPLCIDGWDGT